MNFSSDARLASMVTDRKRRSTRRTAADKSTSTDTSSWADEFLTESGSPRPKNPSAWWQRRPRSSSTTRFMSADNNEPRLPAAAGGERALVRANSRCLQGARRAGDRLFRTSEQSPPRKAGVHQVPFREMQLYWSPACMSTSLCRERLIYVLTTWLSSNLSSNTFLLRTCSSLCLNTKVNYVKHTYGCYIKREKHLPCSQVDASLIPQGQCFIILQNIIVKTQDNEDHRTNRWIFSSAISRSSFSWSSLARLTSLSWSHLFLTPCF